jgi:hypothetical protein
MLVRKPTRGYEYGYQCGFHLHLAHGWRGGKASSQMPDYPLPAVHPEAALTLRYTLLEGGLDMYPICCRSPAAFDPTIQKRRHQTALRKTPYLAASEAAHRNNHYVALGCRHGLLNGKRFTC